ncbi:hypothetical protein F6V30_07945 [Oryzomonas sagensis]|uniref:Uncharacterized protein n=2 Tax=Oryzomonas sagensis TaxID=2603857 RepID=A0ABQ6TPK7_9BACT|nr:hypothetical protein F6V30_07945 [Oryzomonas sagensis]
MVQFSVDMTEQEAWALAQFIKRSRWQQYRDNAVDEEDAYNMMDALSAVRDALAKIKFSPR